MDDWETRKLIANIACKDHAMTNLLLPITMHIYHFLQLSVIIYASSLRCYYLFIFQRLLLKKEIEVEILHQCLYYVSNQQGFLWILILQYQSMFILNNHSLNNSHHIHISGSIRINIIDCDPNFSISPESAALLVFLSIQRNFQTPFFVLYMTIKTQSLLKLF